MLTCQGVPLAKITPLPPVETPVSLKLGLNEGAMVMSDDFDEPLPDSFWGL